MMNTSCSDSVECSPSSVCSERGLLKLKTSVDYLKMRQVPGYPFKIRGLLMISVGMTIS